MPDIEVADIHLDPTANVFFLLGEHRVERITLSHGEDRDRLLHELDACSPGDSRILVCRLSPAKELISRAFRSTGLGVHLDGSLDQFRKAFDDIEWSEVGSIAVFPNFDSARFCFPVTDHSSHYFLIRQVLFPRRYSLTLKTRLLLRVYLALLRLFPKATFPYRDVCLGIEKR